MSTTCLTERTEHHLPTLSVGLQTAPGDAVVAGPGTALSPHDRAELGTALLDLLCDLHASLALRPRPFQTAAGPGMEVALVVPGSGQLVTRVLPLPGGGFELSVSSALWEDLVVLREADGRLGGLYRDYFWWRECEEKQAKDRLLEGFNQLRWVQSWGVDHGA